VTEILRSTRKTYNILSAENTLPRLLSPEHLEDTSGYLTSTGPLRRLLTRIMTTFIPRQSYSQDEIDKLYPKELELQLVQIVCTSALIPVV
jgi:hypothetical protein